MDIRKIKKLIDLMIESDLQSIEVKEGDQSIALARRNPIVAAGVAPLQAATPEAPVVKAASHRAAGCQFRAAVAKSSPRSGPALSCAARVGQQVCRVVPCAEPLWLPILLRAPAYRRSASVCVAECFQLR